jgi:hypothetical protein
MLSVLGSATGATAVDEHKDAPVPGYSRGLHLSASANVNRLVPEILTLVTCYPFYLVGSAPSRLIVRAERLT